MSGRAALRRAWAIALTLLLVSAVCLLFSTRKQGMFIDEIYTYGLSNSSFAPFLPDALDGSIAGKVLTRGELFDYVAVTGDEGFDFASVYYNQVNDVHPPLYYWLFNIASTFAKGSFSKWTGLVLDWLLYSLCVWVLYLLARRLGASRFVSAATAMLYGLSLLGLSTMLMIRMYVLLALLTTLLAYWIACLMRDFRPRCCVFVALTLLAGLMTQYYFVFYAFFLCAAYVLWALARREFKALAWFIPCALAGALALLLVFPACLTHLFSGELVSGESAVDNLKNLAQYPVRLRTFLGFVVHGFKAGLLIGALGLAALLFCAKGVKQALREGRARLDWLVFLIPAAVTYLLVAIISPVDEARYFYNIVPIFALGAGFLLYLLEEAQPELSPRYRALIFLAVTLLALWEARSAPPDFLYPEHAEYNRLCAEHADDPCVYFSDGHFEAVTEDLIQLMAFDEFYVTGTDRDLSGMLAYAGEAEEVVVFIDISEFWSSGYKAEEILARIASETPYTHAAPLYEAGLSTTYVVSR